MGLNNGRNRMTCSENFKNAEFEKIVKVDIILKISKCENKQSYNKIAWQTG